MALILPRRRPPEFESEERVGTAIFEFDNIAVHVAVEGDRVHDADRAEIVLGDRANDIDSIALLESLQPAVLDYTATPGCVALSCGGVLGEIGLKRCENSAALFTILDVFSLGFVELNASFNDAEELRRFDVCHARRKKWGDPRWASGERSSTWCRRTGRRIRAT